MTEQEVKALLNQYAQCKFAVDALRFQKQEMREKAMAEIEAERQAVIETLPPGVKQRWFEMNQRQAQLDMEIDAEFEGKGDDAEANSVELEAKIRRAVLEAGATIKGEYYTCQWKRGSTKIAGKALELAIKNVPGIEAYIEYGEPSTAMVINKGK